jgi:hypothetical protein
MVLSHSHLREQTPRNSRQTYADLQIILLIVKTLLFGFMADLFYYQAERYLYANLMTHVTI